MNLSSKNLVLVNAQVITLDPLLPRVDWIGVRNTKVHNVGIGKDWTDNHGSRSTVIDLKGKTVVPGFIDAHLHILATVKGSMALDLSSLEAVRSIADIASVIHSYSQDIPPGNWIFGRGYNEFYLLENCHPDRWDLDRAAPSHPVKLTHRSGHVHVLNSLALNAIGVTGQTGDPEGGIIDRDLNTGEPTGILYEAADFLSGRIPPLQVHELEAGLQMANSKFLSAGITSIHDASHRNDAARWNIIKGWKSDGKLTPRTHMMLGYPSFQKNEHYLLSDFSEPYQLQSGAVKIMLDDTTGRMLPAQKELNQMVHEIHKAGMQVAFHAIEEASIEAACQAVAFASERLPHKEHRHRIEHCSVCPPRLAQKIASLKMSVVTQPSFIFHSGQRYLKTVPREQLGYLYPIRTLLSHGINVAASSDSPVVSPDPLIGIYAATSRLAENNNLVGEHEKISIMDALRMYTQNAARAAFQDNIKGTVTPGKLADLVVLNADPRRLSASEFKHLKVDMTILGGEVVYRRQE